MTDDYYRKLDFMHVLIQKKLDNINAAYTALGTKASWLIGFVGTVLAFYISLLYQNDLLSNIPQWLYTMRIGSIISLFFCLLFLVMAIKTRDTDDGPPLKVFLEDDSLKKEYHRLKREVLYDMKVSYLTNKATQEDIAFWFNISLGLFFFSISLMIISSII